MARKAKEKPTAIIDTREQMPLDFVDGLVRVERGTLPIGDYALRGDEAGCVIERKSLPDLLNCLGNDRARFVREIKALRTCSNPILLVESDWGVVLAGEYEYSTIHPNSVLGSLMSFSEYYGITTVMADDHAQAGRMAERLLWLHAKRIKEKYARIFFLSSICEDSNPTAKELSEHSVEQND